MKIDIEVIRGVLISIDPEAHLDPEFERMIDMAISEIVRKQKEKNGTKFN
mgnify:CR=1 FL=1